MCVSGEQQLLKSRRKLRARATPGCRPAFALTASGRERGAGVSAAHPAQAWGIGLASKRTCEAESRLRAIGGSRSSANGSNPNNLGPGSLKGKTCNVC